MPDQKVHFTVSFRIHPDRSADFERIAQQMIEVSRTEPGTLAYGWYLSPQKDHCRLLESYVDAAAASSHLRGSAVRHLVPQLMDTCTPTCFEVYGDPGKDGEEVLAPLGANIFSRWLTLEP